MGTTNFSVGGYSRFGGYGGSGPIMSSKVRTSGSFTTSTSADNLEDGSGEVTVNAGEVIVILPTVAGWVSLAGAAAVGTGIPCPADQVTHIEVQQDHDGNNISYIEG